jgi:type IV pilus assembly protein PilO
VNRVLDAYVKLPRSQRLLVVGLVYVFIIVAFYFSLISPVVDEISSAERQQNELVTKRNQVRQRAENRAAFEAELGDLTAELKQALKELPNDREIPGLLSEIDGHARKSALDVRRFQPLPELLHEYYAEVPVSLMMDGGYHEIGMFFDRVRMMGRIVSVQDIQISDPVASGSDTRMKVSAQAVTYRFLTDAEIEAQRNKPKPKGKAAGGGGGE